MTTWILFVIFFLLLAFGIPIAFVLVISTVGYAFIIGDISWALISQRMIYGINIFVMISLAILYPCRKYHGKRGNYQAAGRLRTILRRPCQGRSCHGRRACLYAIWYCIRLSHRRNFGGRFPLNSCHEKRRISIGLLRWTDFGGIYLLPCHTAVIGFRHICFLREGIGK